MLKVVLLVVTLTLNALVAPLSASPAQADKKKQKGSAAPALPTRESWAWRYGGLRYDSVTSVLRSGDGGFVLAGDTRSFRVGKKQDYRRDPYDVWVVKLDSVGGITPTGGARTKSFTS